MQGFVPTNPLSFVAIPHNAGSSNDGFLREAFVSILPTHYHECSIRIPELD
jgi:hypothetical protein